MCDIFLKVNLSWHYLHVNIICLAAECLAQNKHRIVITSNPRGLKYAKTVIAGRKFISRMADTGVLILEVLKPEMYRNMNNHREKEKPKMLQGSQGMKMLKVLKT